MGKDFLKKTQCHMKQSQVQTGRIIKDLKSFCRTKEESTKVRA